MKKIIALTVILLILGLGLSRTTGAAQFGNIAIYLDSAITEDFSRMGIQLQGQPMLRFFDDKDRTIFWNIHPGRYDVQLNFPDDRKPVSIKVEVFPGLTNRVYIESNNDQYFLIENGFVDQGGHLMRFNRAEMNRLPGELSDGLGILSPAGRDSVSYSYEGLSFVDPSQGRLFAPSSKTLPDLALVNISDPFAGYGGEEVSLISNYSGPEKMGGDYTYTTRDQRYYRIVAKHQLPREVGSVFGSLGYENLADAAPRWNVDGRLPHNGAENVELLGGAGLDILTRFKADLKFFYKSLKRDYYEHAFYFDYEHSPREELKTYSGDMAVSGWLMNDLFINAGFGIAGDDSKTGDGVLFDDITAYHQDQFPNPGTDQHHLFYRWDDYWTVTDTIDEAHYYDTFKRYKSSTTNGFLQLKKQIKDNAEVWSDFEFSRSTFRKYVNFNPTRGYSTDHVENIGFDTLGNETNDKNYFAEIPRPMYLKASLGGKLLEKKYFLKGAIDFEMFDPGALVFRDPSNPLDPDNTNEYLLDETDMTDADTKTNVGFRAAAGLSLTESFGLFGNASISYIYPSNDTLYAGYAFLETRMVSGYYVYSNPDLDPVQYTNLEFGINGTYHYLDAALSYQRRLIDNMIIIYHFLAVPYSYDMLASSGAQNSENAIVLSCQRSGNHLFSGAISAEVAWRDSYVSLAGYNVAWMHAAGTPAAKQDFTTYRLSGMLGLNPKALNLDRDRLFGKVLSRLAMNLSFNYRSGLRYTVFKPYDAVSFASIQIEPLSPLWSEKARDFFEINLAVTANLAEFRGASMSLSFEVLNLLDRDNHLYVYGATGEPDSTGYEETAEYDVRVDDSAGDPLDSSGLTFAEKYSLRQDDPNNFYRPRMFRVLARLEF